MKLAIVHEMLIKLGGAERVLKKLSDTFPKAQLYALLRNPRATDEWLKNRTIRTSDLQKWYRALGQPKFLLPFMSGAIEALDLRGFDTVITSSSAFAHGVKVDKKAKHICYCHSPMRYAWDYTHEYTQNYGAFGRWIIAKLLSSIRQWDFQSAQAIDVILANSEHTRKRIQKYWRRDATVVYPPVNVKKFTPRTSHEDYFLIVSALTPFKRIDLAIQAFNKIKRRLVIIGDGAQRTYLESISGDTIEFLGRKPDDVVKEYYENCRAFIFPGEEDFGITPVEAMAAGKPVLAYGVGGVTESVKAGVSGEFFYQPTPEALEDGLIRLLMHEKQYDTQKICRLAERFDEAVFEEKMQNLIKH